MSWTATHSWAYKEAPSSTVFNTQLRDNMDYLKTAVEQAVAVGTVTMFGGTIAPTGFLLCQGQAVLRSTYAALFAIIGVAYGNGDNSTTFNLPNFQACFPAGKHPTTTLGQTGGEATHTLTVAELAVHTHTQNAHAHFMYSHIRANLNFAGGGLNPFVNDDADMYTEATTATNQNTGSNMAHNNMPPYQVVNYIIKF